MNDDSFHLLYRTFLKRAATENKTETPNNVWAMCRGVEHRDGQHWYDRNRYGELVRELRAELSAEREARLASEQSFEARIAALEARR